MNKVFKYINLFSDIGGFEQALESFGGECVFTSEIDEFVTQAYGTKDIPDHDLLVTGFPYQSFSVVGNVVSYKRYSKRINKK